jgi:threonine dehydrogenase-like Zn-dependent dehydrogenase
MPEAAPQVSTPRVHSEARADAGNAGSMRGVVQTGPRRLALVDVPRPQLEPGTAIIRVQACGICGTDVVAYRQRTDAEQGPGGHEFAGEVMEIAPRPGEQPHLRVGDLVAVDAPGLGRACGACRWCAAGAFIHCLNARTGPDWGGGFAEYAKRDVRGLFPLPPGLDARAGALLEPFAVAVHALRVTHAMPGERIAVIGAGAIGLACVMAAVAMGLGPVYVGARYPHQAALARSFGAATVSTGNAEELREAVRDATGGTGVDLVLETVGGTAPTLDEAWGLVRTRGRVAVLGLFAGRVPVDLETPLWEELSVVFPLAYGALDGRHDYDVALELVATGKAPLMQLMSHQFPLARATEAFEIAADKRSSAVRVLLGPG